MCFAGPHMARLPHRQPVTIMSMTAWCVRNTTWSARSCHLITASRRMASEKLQVVPSKRDNVRRQRDTRTQLSGKAPQMALDFTYWILPPTSALTDETWERQVWGAWAPFLLWLHQDASGAPCAKPFS